jgi:alkylation response protein AidB-like acyl-CoA dehydrogenase
MKFEFTDEHDGLRALVADGCAEHANPRGSYDDDSPLDAELWATLASAGLTGVGVPDAFEGGGGGPVELTIIAEELGRNACAVPFAEHSAAAEAIALLGSEEQRKRLLIPLSRGEVVAAHVLLEPGTTPRVTAHEDGSGFRLGGVLPLAPNAAAAQLIVVPALLGERVHYFATDSARVTTLPTVDRTRPAAAIDFTGANGELLPGDEPADRIDELLLTMAAAEAVGAATAALQMTTKYGVERHQFGLPIGTFQAVKHRLADMLVAVENGRSAVYGAAWALEDDPTATMQAAMAQAVATENATRVVSDAIQLHGGIGVTWECDLHLYLRRAKALELTYGAPAWHRARIAAALLDV